MTKFLPLLFLAVFTFQPVVGLAQETTFTPDKITTTKAVVLDIIDQKVEAVPGTDIQAIFQTIKVKILEGEEKNKIVTVTDDHLKLKVGEVFYLSHTTGDLEGNNYYSVAEVYRLPVIIFFVGLFIVLVLVFGGIQGIRGLLSLGGSFILIMYVLLPGILQGYSPILMSLGVSALIIILGSYITHGFNKTTSSAVIGMIITVVFTGLLAYLAVRMGRLSGFSNEEAMYLNINTQGSIDFVGLLLGGILIGLLGVLYDVAIGQAISVEELNRVAPHLPRSTIFKRAIRIGREHIGALVNTLAIAYVGVSLPLLLLYLQSSNSPLGMTINREIFATEIIRTMIGSIGLVMAVPITTFIAVCVLMKPQSKKLSKEDIQRQEKELDHLGHHH